MVKMRWSNSRHQIEFDANDPDEFYSNCLIALRQFRILTERQIHRGEIHKTVLWYEPAQLGVYDKFSKQWYNLEGDHHTLDTQSFGRIAIARHFTVETPHVEADNQSDGRANSTVHLTCLDPVSFEVLDLSSHIDSGQVWNMCIHAHQRAENINSFVDGFMNDFDKTIGENNG